MYAKLDYNVLAADLDPQANLTAQGTGMKRVNAGYGCSRQNVLAPPQACE